MPTSPSSDRTAGTDTPYGGRLMFTQSWEDAACDRRALGDLAGRTLLAITSGGDNVLGFLLADPARIVAVDVNPRQNHLLQLKRAAFRRLTHEEMLALLGVRPPHAAAALYARIRGDLDADARTFWDAHTSWFSRGLLTCGGFERYFAALRGLLRWVVGRRRMERLFTLAPEEQQRFYEREWNTARWRALVRMGCSRFVLGRRLDPSWFTHAEVTSFGRHFERLAAHVLGELPARTNYFLAQILLGRYCDETRVPDYLLPGSFETIRARLDRIEPVTGDIGDVLVSLPASSVDAFAFSNVFEYSPPDLFARARGQIARAARPGARVALRNLLAPRRLQGDPAFAVDAPLGEALRRADRGFIYSHFEAAVVRGSAA